MPHKVEIPKGSGKYYAYRKEEGRTTYVGPWAEHLKEVKLEEYFKGIFSKSRPIETDVMITDGNVRHFRTQNLTDEQIDLAIEDLREFGRQTISKKFPEYEGLLREIWLSEDPNFSAVNLKEEDLELLSSGLIRLEIPAEMVPRFANSRKKPDEEIDTVLMRMGDEKTGFGEAIEREMTIHYINNKYGHSVQRTPDEVLISVPTEAKALELEEDLHDRGVRLDTDVMYKSSVVPRRIILEIKKEEGGPKVMEEEGGPDVLP